MTQFENLLIKVLRGASDSNIDFDDLYRLLTELGFEVRIRAVITCSTRQA